MLPTHSPNVEPSTPLPRRKSRLSTFHRRSLTRTPLISLTNRSSPRRLPPSTSRPSLSHALSPHHLTPSTPNASPNPRINSRLSIRPSPSATPKTATASRRKSTRFRLQQMSKTEIEQMYSDTIKLCQDNKINVKNTWNLSLIDYMAMMFRNDDANVRKSLSAATSSEEMNFHRAGVTLDAGVKIYGSRVDSVHNNALKVLGGLSRTGAEDEINNEGEGGDEAADDDEGNARRRKGRRTGRATLETNMSNITSAKLETDLAVDPLFQKMSAAFDEGGAKGMLLNNLPVGSQGQVVFDSGELAESLVGGGDELENRDAVYNAGDAGMLPAEAPAESDALCPMFLRFFKSKERMFGTEEEEMHIENTPDGNEEDNNTGVDFEYDNSDLQNTDTLTGFAGAEVGSEVPFSQEGMGDDDDVFADESGVAMRQSLDCNMSMAMAARRGSLDLVEAGVTLTEDSEYSFFDTSAISGWAGPQHWRFRAVTASSIGTEGAKKSKRPRGKNAMLLDFSEAAPKIDYEKAFAQGKSETSFHLSKTVREGSSEKRITLPEDLHFSVRTLRSLFLKKNTYVRPKSAASKLNIEAGGNDATEGWYDFENDCDKDNFVPADGGDEVDFDNEQGFEESETLLSTEIDLIPEPTRVDKIDINYAKVAKKVDVRLLKSGMWSRLCGEVSSPRASLQGAGDNNSGESESPPDVLENDLGDIREGKVQTLRGVVQDMPDFVPESSLEDVSLPYVFICLLHLANEKTLKIERTGTGEFQDLVITAGEPENA